MVTKHVLKTINPYFQDVWSGIKQFEVRKNDRGFQIGDQLVLREYDGSYSGRKIDAEIIYILEDFPAALKEGYAILGFKRTGRWVPFPC